MVCDVPETLSGLVAAAWAIAWEVLGKERQSEDFGGRVSRVQNFMTSLTSGLRGLLIF